MVLLSSEMVFSSSRIEFFASSMASFVSSRSLSHHSFCCTSAFSSSSMRWSILPISSTTVLKGLLACSIAKMRVSSGAPWVSAWAACRKVCARNLRTPKEASSEDMAACWRCTRMVLRRSWMSATPLLVAETVPKVAKASSLKRMEIASDKAASSCALRATRSSYCLLFAAHMSTSLDKKSSASANCVWAASSWLLFAAKSSSLSPSWPCLSS
mmetsp:Transcript_60775/g.159189  ORF Transcript_60775/g.159189 Transcript_60775/m.159189 type:complete len:213 (-) Transcript_60775:624-1262(-)